MESSTMLGLIARDSVWRPRVIAIAETAAFTHWNQEVQVHAGDVFVLVKRKARAGGYME